MIRFDDMLTTRGARFGGAFDPEDVGVSSWGSLTLELTCDGGTARYASIEPGFGDGQLHIQPLTQLLECL